MENISENLLGFEKEIFFIIKEAYNNLDDKSKIKKYIQFTEKTNFFYKESSFLYRDLICKKIEQNLRDEEYKSYEIKIEEEYSKLNNLKEFNWEEEIINRYKEILDKYLEEVKNKIIIKKQDIELEKEIKKLNELKQKLNRFKLNGSYAIFKGQIIEKINNLLNENLEEISKKRPIIEKEIEALKLSSKDIRNISILGNNLDWGSPIVSIEKDEEFETLKLYKNMLYYATYNQLLKTMLKSNDEEISKYKYTYLLEELGLFKYFFCIEEDSWEKK